MPSLRFRHTSTAVAALAALLTTVPTAAAAGIVRPHDVIVAPGVQRGSIIVRDTSRWTVSHGHVLSHSRTMPVTVWRPTTPGRHPLVVFAHGFDITPVPYTHMLVHWAQAGFVVAAPYFPLTRADAGRWLDEADVDQQPRDVSFVITALEQRLAPYVDPAHVVVAGHSDGGSTAFGTVFADRTRDVRVTAVMVFSGDKRRTMGHFTAHRTPMLQVQSDADEFNPMWAAAQVWAVPRGPKVYLRLHGARHLPPFTNGLPWRDIVEAVTTDFLKAWTTTDPAARLAARNQLDRDGNRTGYAAVADVR